MGETQELATLLRCLVDAADDGVEGWWWWGLVMSFWEI